MITRVAESNDTTSPARVTAILTQLTSEHCAATSTGVATSRSSTIATVVVVSSVVVSGGLVSGGLVSRTVVETTVDVVDVKLVVVASVLPLILVSEPHAATELSSTASTPTVRHFIAAP